MSTDDLIKEAERKMGQSIEHLEQELLSIRTGRANPALIEGPRIPRGTLLRNGCEKHRHSRMTVLPRARASASKRLLLA